jgi:hypothetical protein
MCKCLRFLMVYFKRRKIIEIQKSKIQEGNGHIKLSMSLLKKNSRNFKYRMGVYFLSLNPSLAVAIMPETLINTLCC